MYTTVIQTPSEFSFKECYSFINRSENECLHHAFNNKIRKLIKISKKFLLFDVESESGKNIQINFLNLKPSKTEISFVKNFVGDWFDLSTNIKPFYKFCSKDKLLRNISKKYYGLRLIGIPDLFEALTWAIIGQQINLTFAYILKRRFVETFGEKLIFKNQSYHIYPSPEKILNISESELLQLQFSKQKTKYVLEAAKTIAEKKITKEDLQRLSFNEAKAKLCELHGIGNWTANYVIMKCLRNLEAFPIEDVGLHNAIKYLLKLKTKPTLQEIKTLSSGWNGWHGYSTFYLWRSLINN